MTPLWKKRNRRSAVFAVNQDAKITSLAPCGVDEAYEGVPFLRADRKQCCRSRVGQQHRSTLKPLPSGGDSDSEAAASRVSLEVSLRLHVNTDATWLRYCALATRPTRFCEHSGGETIQLGQDNSRLEPDMTYSGCQTALTLAHTIQKTRMVGQ